MPRVAAVLRGAGVGAGVAGRTTVVVHAMVSAVAPHKAAILVVTMRYCCKRDRNAHERSARGHAG
jgi:tartrate dehydratase alpha subunit/fumarate hydratase class I-like protein